MLHFILSAFHVVHAAAIVIHVILVLGESWHKVSPLLLA